MKGLKFKESSKKTIEQSETTVYTIAHVLLARLRNYPHLH